MRPDDEFPQLMSAHVQGSSKEPLKATRKKWELKGIMGKSHLTHRKGGTGGVKRPGVAAGVARLWSHFQPASGKGGGGEKNKSSGTE